MQRFKFFPLFLAAKLVFCKLPDIGVTVRPDYVHPRGQTLAGTAASLSSFKRDEGPKPDVLNTTLHSCGNNDGPRNVLCFPLSDDHTDGFVAMSVDDDISPMGMCDPGRSYDILTQMNDKCTQASSEYCTASMTYKCDFVGFNTHKQGPDGVQTCKMTMTTDLNPSGGAANVNQAIKGLAQAYFFAMGSDTGSFVPYGQPKYGYGSYMGEMQAIMAPLGKVVGIMYRVPHTVHVKHWLDDGAGGSNLHVSVDCYRPPPPAFDICKFVTGLIGAFVPFVGPAFAKAGSALSDTTKAMISSASSGSSQFCMIG